MPHPKPELRTLTLLRIKVFRDVLKLWLEMRLSWINQVGLTFKKKCPRRDRRGEDAEKRWSREDGLE